MNMPWAFDANLHWFWIRDGSLFICLWAGGGDIFSRLPKISAPPLENFSLIMPETRRKTGFAGFFKIFRAKNKCPPSATCQKSGSLPKISGPFPPINNERSLRGTTLQVTEVIAPEFSTLSSELLAVSQLDWAQCRPDISSLSFHASLCLELASC